MRINPSRLPNLLIVGAPRCGTTSLHDWLVAHPQIQGAARKETFYLMDRESFEFVPGNNFHERGLEGYAGLFERCVAADIRIESTTGYLYQDTALRVLSELPGEPRFIVVLREPADRVMSTFRYFQGHKAQLPRDLNFRRFVEAVDQGERSVQSNEFLRDSIEHSRYAKHLARWRDRVGRSHLRVVLLEDLRRGASSIVPKIAVWAGVEPEFYASYDWPRRNESYRVRFPALHAAVRSFVLPLVRNERHRRRMRDLYVKLNSARANPADEDESAVLAVLRKRFAEDNARLAEEWKLDLSAWSSAG